MRDKLIIPIILDDVNLSPAMEYYLASNHYLKFFQDKDFSSQLINRVYSLLGLKNNAVSQESLTTISSENEDIFSKANNGDLPSLCEIGRKLSFSKRTINCLNRAGIVTLGELLCLSKEDLLRIRNLGAQCLNEIVDELSKYDLELRKYKNNK